ncbi:aminotransferase class V-fold PLP-dependent enzyme [bacterium]|nr:aminotransferase class V-fold PLP-dependent enzyme [bacterium]
MSQFHDFSAEKWRKLFPVTDHSIYVNHAACSPVSTRVRTRIEKLLEDSSTTAVDNFPKWLEMRENLRELAAKLINAKPSQVAFVKNTSEGLNILASGLTWKQGDRVLLADCEFPSNVYPFLNLKKYGVEIDFVKNKNGFLDTTDFERMLTPQTRLLSVSFVEFVNGFKNDLKTLGELCRSRGIIFCVDSIQGLGAVPLDVEKFQIDYLANGGHKWLMGPAGIGLIYVRDHLFDKIKPQHVGWLSVKDAWNFFDYELDLLDDAKRFETATENWLGVYGLQASLELLLEVGIDNIYRHLMNLTGMLAEGLRQNGLIIASSQEPIHRSGIISFRSGSAERTKNIFEYLIKNHIISSFREGVIRISPHFYNTEDEMREIIRIINTFSKP